MKLRGALILAALPAFGATPPAPTSLFGVTMNPGNGSLSVPLPIGIPRQKPLNSPTPLSPVSAGPVDALGTIGEDGIFHVK